MIESRNHMGWLGALTMALVLGSSQRLDSPDDARANWDQSGALKELQATEAGEPTGTTWLAKASP